MAAGVRAPALSQKRSAPILPLARAVRSPTRAAAASSELSAQSARPPPDGARRRNDVGEVAGGAIWRHCRYLEPWNGKGKARQRRRPHASIHRAWDHSPSWSGCPPPAGLKATCHALPEVMLAGIRGRNEEEAAAKGQLTVGGNWSGGE